jgi:hypothetical protein
MGSTGAATNIIRWDLPSSCDYYQLDIHRDMAFLHVYIKNTRMVHVYIRWVHVLLPATLATRERNIHPGTWPPCIYQNGICGAATSYYQQLVPQGRNIPRDMAFLHVYIRMGSTRCCDYY